jgi:hypothetical protein
VKAIGAVSRAGSAIITRTHGSTNGLTWRGIWRFWPLEGISP